MNVQWSDCYDTQGSWTSLLLLLFSRPVVSYSLQPHGLQHARAACPSPSPSLPKFMFIVSVMPSSRLIAWYPLLLLPSIYPSIRDFSSELSICIRWPKYTGASALASVLPVNIQGCSPLRLNSLISLLSKGLLGVFSRSTVWGHQFFGFLPSLGSEHL